MSLIRGEQITGSVGTASFAVSSSYAESSSYAVSASYEINYETSSSYADYAVSASYSENASSSSYAISSSYAPPTLPGGINNSVQFKSGSKFNGSPNLLFNSDINTLDLTGSIIISEQITNTSLSGATERILSTTSGELSASLEILELDVALANYTGSLTAADLTISQSAVISGSLNVLNSVTASYFSGSFIGDGTNLYNIPASGITGLNLSQIASGSVTASISPDAGLIVNTTVSASSFSGSGDGLFNIPASGIVGLNLSQIASGSATASISPDNGLQINVDTVITGSLNVTAGITGSLYGTASYAETLNGFNSSSFVRTDLTDSSVQDIQGTLKLTGDIIAENYIISSSVLYVTTSYSSGSTRWGDRLDNTHQFTGSVYITGSLTSPSITGSLYGTSSWAVNALTASSADNFIIRNELEVTGSSLLSGSLTLSGSASVSGSLYASSIETSVIYSLTSGSITGSIFVISDDINPIFEVNSNKEVIINGTLNANSTYNNAVTASLTLAQIDINSANSAYIDYRVKNTINSMRAGNIVAVWDNSNFSSSYSETSTMDINGSTAGVSFNMEITGSYMNLRAIISSGSWEIKTGIKTL